jgi:signal transduction histidine kinase/CheY-like chemotaxis protein
MLTAAEGNRKIPAIRSIFVPMGVFVLLVICVFALLLCGLAAAAWLFLRRMRHDMREKIRALEERLEAAADWNWELKEAGERARSLLDAQGDVIVRRDGAEIVTYANDAFCALVGQQRDAIVGTQFQVPVVEQSEATVLPDGTRVHDQKIVTPNGGRWISWREVVVRDARHAQTERQSVGRDVTAQTEATHALAEARDQAESASRAKSRFLAVVSHEIRTPLNGILGMADLLRDTTLTPEQTTYVNAVVTSGHTLLSLIEDVLDFSKIEAGKIALERRPFSLSTLVEGTVELLAPRAQAKGLDVGSYLDDGLPRCVVGDADRLRQVLLNLAGNAIKFTESGGVAVIVTPGPQSGEVTFTVEDTGIGIDPDAQQRIFKEFEQADAGATRRFGGTGLGLAISRGIVESMAGDIRLESEPGRGARFSVTVPLPDAAEAAEEQAAPPHLNGTDVLIVSSSVITPLIGRQIENAGAHVSIATDMSDAVRDAGASPWSAILADSALGMPALQAILQAGMPSTSRRLALITPTERAHLPALREAGMTGYLIKPVRSASLLAVLTGAETEAEETAVPLNPAAAPPTAPDSVAVSLKVLVAEDNEINALLTRSLLEKLGHQPTLAGDGAAALDLWRAEREGDAPYDLVLMDVNMPVMDGVEAARRMRAMEEEDGAPPTRIVALSANAFADDRATCLAAGMNAFLVKPLHREQLITTLEELGDPKRAAA